MPISLFFAFVMLGLMWLVVIAPQQKRVKAHNMVVSSLEVDQEVVTTSGICGRIVDLDGEFAWLDIAEGVTVKFDRRAVATVVDTKASATDPAGTEG